MAARGYGRGSISQRTDGLWVGRIDVSKEPRKRITFSSKDRSAVEAKLDAWLEANRPRQAEPRPIGNRSAHMERARAIARHTAAQWREKESAARGLCHYCQRSVSLGGVKDHVTPVSRGGSDGIDNVVLACWDCNAAKSDMDAEEFRQWAADTDFFSQPQRTTISTAKGNRRIPRNVAAIMRIPVEERGPLLESGKFAARVRLEMERM